MNYSPKHFKLPAGGVLPLDEARGVSPYVFDNTMAIAIDVALASGRDGASQTAPTLQATAASHRGRRPLPQKTFICRGD